MTITQRDRELGTAYAMKPPTSRTELTSVGRGTPMGELLRRYWHPVGLVSDANDIPRKVRVLGEDLILFRYRLGHAGLLHARCCHRGTTLYYGKVEDDGIRCCYHGWKFDAEGRCLEQPGEVDGGQRCGVTYRLSTGGVCFASERGRGRHFIAGHTHGADRCGRRDASLGHVRAHRSLGERRRLVWRTEATGGW